MASDHTCDFQEEDDTGSTTNQFATQEHQSGGDTATPGRGMPSRVGDYEILSQLGEGGMGVVYKARHLGLKRLVALKMIRAAGASDRDRLRFQAEVEAVARLQHPGIVGIFEVGEFAGQPFCALEFVEGGSLDVRLARQALPTHKAARLMESLARAAHAVHELHLVHRDLKPANILVQGQPDDPLEHCTLKISDFGLAKMLDNEEMGVTREGSVLGTPFYMAPEQAAGRIAEIDRRADVYSLGAILYEMLTGKPPLKGDSLSETLWKVMNEEPVAPRRVGANIDRDIDIVCRKCLEKDPEQRFATARDLADELERYLNDEPILTRQAGLVERGLKWVRRRPALAAIWILGLLIAVLGSASAFAGWQWLQAEAARGQAELSRQQAEDARQEAENANAGLAQQKRLADEAKSWALKDRLSFEQALEKAREPVSRIESTVRQEFEQQRKKLLQGFYLTQIDLAHRYWQDAEVAQARRLFDSCSVERASWEYTYIDRLCHGADLPRPAVPLGAVSMAEFNHDGSRLVVVGSQGTGCWDFPARTNSLALPIRPTSIRFTPDGKWLVVAQNKGVRLIDAHTGKDGRSLDHLTARPIRQVALTPDGKRLVVAAEESDVVLVVDFATGKPVFSLPGHGNDALAVACSSDGKWLATATGSAFHLWDAATGKPTHLIQAGLGGHNHPLAFSFNGRQIACIDGGGAGVWDVATGQKLAQVHTSQRTVRCVGLVPDGTLVTGGSDTTVRSWNMPAGKAMQQFRGLPGEVEGMTLHPRRRVLVAWDRDGSAIVWDPATNQESQSIRSSDPLRRVVFLPESRRLAAVTSGHLLEFDPATGKELAKYPGATGHAPLLAHGGKGRWLASGQEGVVVIDRTTGRETWRDKTPVHVLALSPVGDRMVVGGERLACRDPATGRELLVFEKRTVRANAAVFSPDGTKVAVADDQGVQVYEGQTGKLLNEFNTGRAWALSYSPDGKLLAGLWRNTVLIWDTSTGRETQQITQPNLILALAFSADGRRIATCQWDETIRLWDVTTGQLTLTLPVPGAMLTSAHFSFDGRWLACTSANGEARLWDAGHQPGKPPQ